MPGATGQVFTPIRRYAWVILLIRAILALTLGIIVVATGELRPGLANVIGLYWLLGALLTLRWARAHRGARGERVAYGAAFAAVRRAFKRVEMMLAFIGMFSIVVGLLRMSGMFRESVTEDIRRSRPEATILGILEILLGFGLIFGEVARPLVVPILGVWGIAGGTIMLRDAIRAWRVLQPGAFDRQDGEGDGPEARTGRWTRRRGGARARRAGRRRARGDGGWRCRRRR